MEPEIVCFNTQTRATEPWNPLYIGQFRLWAMSRKGWSMFDRRSVDHGPKATLHRWACILQLLVEEDGPGAAWTLTVQGSDH